MRTVLTVITLVLYFLITFPFSVLLFLLRKVNRKLSSRISQAFVRNGFRCVMWVAGMKRTVLGLENVPKDRPVLFAANHKSIIDAPLGYITLPVLTGFVSKKEIAKVPFLHLWMLNTNCLFLDRQDIKAGMKTILTCIDYIKDGYSIFIAPEGTRSHTEEPLPFKDGSLKPASKTGCPIIPVAITGTDDLFENNNKRIHKAHVIIEYGKPIDLASLSEEDRKHPGEYVRGVVMQMLEKQKTMLSK